MKRQTPVAIAALALIAILLTITLQRQPRTDRRAGGFSTAQPVPGQNKGPLPGAVPNGGKGIRSMAIPEPYDARQEEIDEALRNALAAHEQAVADATEGAGNMTPISPVQPPAHLLPRQQPLTHEQAVALDKLRWKTAGKHLDYRTSPETSSLRLLRGRRLEPAAESPEATADNFLANNSALLRIDQAEGETQLRSTSQDELGYTQLRYTTAYKGLEVWPSSLTVQLDPEGDVGLLTGAYAPTPGNLDTTPAIDLEGARRAALKAVGASPLLPHDPGALKVYAPTTEPDPVLAWHFSLQPTVDQHWNVFVDAQTGDVLHKHNCICTAAVQGSGTDSTGQSRPLNLWQHTSGGYFMIDTSKPMFQAGQSNLPQNVTGGIVINRALNAVIDNTGSLKSLGEPILFSTSESATSGFSPRAVAASANISLVYDFFLETFNRNSYDGAGGNIVVFGEIPGYDNAAFSHEGGMMFIGDAQPYAASLDVMAHEVSHGVVGSSAGLIYMDQSGALNESFADIFGEAVETFRSGKSKPDWLIGSALPNPFRSMSNPSSKTISGQGPYPDRMSKFIVTKRDKGGVHWNSSIQNYAFYQLVEGLPNSISLADGLKIFYRALTTKLNKDSQFIDSRIACVLSAEELFGAASVHAQRVAQAFDAVELFDQNGSPGEAPIPTVAASDSTMFTFPSGFSTWLGRRDSAFNDPPAGVFLGANGIQTPAAPNKKPSVRGDGTRGIYVMPNFDGALVDTMSGASTPLGLAGQVESVAISGDGVTYGLVLDSGNGSPTQIYIYNATTDQSQIFNASLPAADEPGAGQEDAIILVDALDISPSGQIVFYDALVRIDLPGGGAIENWATFGIDVSGSQIFSLFPPIPGVNLGNPSIGQTRTNLLTFDVQDAFGSHFIYATDLASGALKQVMTLAGGTPNLAPGWPGYNGDDTAIVFTDYIYDPFSNSWESVLAALPIGADGITVSAQGQIWLRGSFPALGTIFRRGGWEGLPEVSAIATSPVASEAGTPGRFRLTRTGSTNRPLGVTYTVTGSAQNGTDFARFPFTATIPAGANSVDLTLLVTDDNTPEGNETATLTILDRVDYRCVGSPATLTIQDNDNASTGFAAWASANGISSADRNGNKDGDQWSNFMEYALGLNPSKDDGTNAVRVSVEGGRLVVQATRFKRAELTYVIEFSSDLKSWSTLGATVQTDNATTLRVRGRNGAPYGRLRVQ